MNATFKKRLRAIKQMVETLESEIESLVEDHESWMDDHESGWEYTKTGEKANDENITMQQLTSYTDQMIDEIDNLLEPEE